MIVKKPILCSFFLFSFSFFCPAFAEILVESVEGSANIQVEGERVWRPLKGDEIIHDNDVIRTSYKSKLVMRAERMNQIVMGSNTKLLVNYTKSKKAKPGVSVTLFEGALFSRIIANVEYIVYTTAASAATENACFSAIVEEKTGRTGFQVLSGSVVAKNLVLKGDIPLIQGGTTVIEPNRPPSPSKPITVAHIEVLSRFFGDVYIQKQVKETGVKPVESAVSQKKRITASATLGKPKYKYNTEPPGEVLKPQFDLNFIMGQVIKDEETYNRLYQSPEETGAFHFRDHLLGVYFRMQSFNGITYPYGGIKMGLRFKEAEAMIHFPFVPLEDGSFSVGEWGSAEAILEKIEHVLWYPSQIPLSVEFGRLAPFTRGYGLSVEDFSYYLPSSAIQKSGIRTAVSFLDWKAEFVTPDAVSFDILMPSITFDNGQIFFLLAYNYDRDENLGLHPGDFKFLHREKTDLPAAGKEAPLHQYDLETAFNVIYRPPIWLQIYAGFSQILSDSGNVGYGAIIPGFSLSWHTYKFLLEMHAHNDRFFSPLYNSFFGEERALYNQDTRQIITLASRITDNASAKGLKIGVSRNFWETSSFEFSYFQNVLGYSSGQKTEVDKDAIVRMKVVLSSEKIKWLRGVEFAFDQYHSGYWGANLFDMTSQSRVGLWGDFIVFKTWEPYFNTQIYFLPIKGTAQPSDLGARTDVCVGITKHF